MDRAVQRALHVEVERMGKAWLSSSLREKVFVPACDALIPRFSGNTAHTGPLAATLCQCDLMLFYVCLECRLRPYLAHDSFLQALDSDDTKALQAVYLSCQRGRSPLTFRFALNVSCWMMMMMMMMLMSIHCVWYKWLSFVRL